jgi:hypothetical protein
MTSITSPLLHCLNRAEGKGLLYEIHIGTYEGHISSRALIAKNFRQGFYWPLIVDDASKIVTTCEAYQQFSPQSRAPSQPS